VCSLDNTALVKQVPRAEAQLTELLTRNVFHQTGNIRTLRAGDAAGERGWLGDRTSIAATDLTVDSRMRGGRETLRVRCDVCADEQPLPQRHARAEPDLIAARQLEFKRPPVRRQEWRASRSRAHAGAHP